MKVWTVRKDFCRKIYVLCLSILTVGSFFVLFNSSRPSHGMLGDVDDETLSQFILSSDFEVNDSRDDFNDKQEPIKLYGPLEDREVQLDQGIFYFVTSGSPDLTSRQSCVVESTAKLHPYKRIFVIFITKQTVDPLNSKVLSILISYGNVYLRSIKLKSFFTNPGAKDWLLNSKFQDSDFYDQYLADALTYSFLERYGGVVLDFDTLLVRAVTSKAESLFTRCSINQLEPQPMALPAHHPLLYDLLVKLPESHDSMNPYSIGKDHLTKMVAKICKVDNIRELEHKECKKSARTLGAVEDFCPVKRFKHWQMFDPKYTKLIMIKIKEEFKSYGVKLWGGEHQGSWGSMKNKTPFYNLANEMCPLTTEVIIGVEHEF